MKKRIAVVAGGNSGEYEVSISSGSVVFRNLDRRRYEPWMVIIRGADWMVIDGHQNIPIDKNDFSFSYQGMKLRFDLVFIAIHGTPGEDGLLQGYFDLVGIPYTSCNAFVSALTFNKFMCKMIVGNLGVSTAKSVLLREGSEFNREGLLRDLGLPLFVKPNNNGSSVGISKVKQEHELIPAINAAFAEDEEVILESFLPGREITCGVLSDRGRLIAFPVTEVIPKNEFFDYDAKYTPGKADEVVPAQITPAEAAACTEKSLMLYEKLGCAGIVRFDYIMYRGTFSFLEANTVPGLSEASIVPKMAAVYGWPVKKLFTVLVENVRISE